MYWAVTVGGRWSMTVCGIRAFVTQGCVSLSSWQALLPSCNVQGVGRVLEGWQGEGTTAACPPNSWHVSRRVPDPALYRHRVICYFVTCGIVNCFLCFFKKAAYPALDGRIIKCWEGSTCSALYLDCFIDSWRERKPIANPLTSLCSQVSHLTTSYMGKVCADGLCFVVQLWQPLPINARFWGGGGLLDLWQITFL